MKDGAADLPFELQVRLGIGHDPHTYRIALLAEEAANALGVAVTCIEGVQSVTLQRIPQEQEGTP